MSFSISKKRTGGIPKITLPSPSLFSNFWSRGEVLERLSHAGCLPGGRDWHPQRRSGRTGTLRSDLHPAGWAALPASPRFSFQQFYESRGWTTGKWLQAGIEMDNTVIGNHPGVTFGFHLCRGNQGSRWLVEGGYELIATPIFKTTRAQRLLLEYDDSRSGSFDPSRMYLKTKRSSSAW